MARVYAIPLYQEECDYASAAEARRGLLSNDPFNMVPEWMGECPVISQMKWLPLRGTDLPDGTLVTIRYRYRYGHSSHQITVQLGRCQACGERVDIGKSLTCSLECKRIYEGAHKKEEGNGKGVGLSAERRLGALLRGKTKEELIKLLGKGK
jgi:hypothetical protein